MLVNGAIFPPPRVLEALAAVVRAVPVPTAAEPTPPKGLLGRLVGRKDVAADAPPAPAMLDHVPIDRMHLPITGFGNRTTTDAHRLADAVAAAAADWTAPKVHFAGGTALDFPGDWSVWAKLDGDLDALAAVARGVTQSVESLGFFVDRRQFQPMLSVATVTPATTGPYLQSVVDALDAFRGEEWTVEVSLTKETFVGERPQLVEFQRIPLAP
jgi:2'-5' RNA ligase